VRTVTANPDNERWLHEPRSAADLKRALDWVATHPIDDVGVEGVMDRLADGKD
jgi:hypothetical protein